jgi:single-stranded-DNA-specific exonuclease
MNKRWLYQTIPPTEEIESLSKEINVNKHLSAVLIQRGITDFASAKEFFRPLLSQLHDPFLMKGMAQAAVRIKKAIDNREKILVYGDYDVDGTTSVALVHSFLKKFYPLSDFYIPDRHAEGYGVSEAGILWAEREGFSLVIALDLGIKASSMVELAKGKGIDFIICDHHLPDDFVPNAVAVLDPKQKDCSYPYKELSGCGLGFKLIQAYSKMYGNEEEVNEYLDLVAVSIASDIVPITGENRILAHFGLKKLNENPRPGLLALKNISAIKNELDISGVVFTLGPRINAAGRVAHARGAVELLISEDEVEAESFAKKINLKNDLRREFDLSITEEAIAMIEGDELLKSANSTVLFKNTWHKGVIGIVAARCIEKYYRPTVIMTESNDKITGSARSVNGFDLYKAIDRCGDLLEKFGGHKYAAGLTLDKNNLSAFQKRFEEVVSASMTEEMKSPVIEINVIISFDDITSGFNQVLRQMAPFGPESPRPVFETKNVFVDNSLSSFKDRHLRFIAGQRDSDATFAVVGFDMIEYYDDLLTAECFDMVFTIEENTYNGNTSIQLRIKDLKFEKK